MIAVFPSRAGCNGRSPDSERPAGTTRSVGRVLEGAFLLIASLALAGCAEPLDSGGVRLTTVPTPPQYVSGGDVLVRIDLPEGAEVEAVSVHVNGVDARAAFRPLPADPLGRPVHGLLGRVTGLRDGANEVVARVRDEVVASLEVTNYPITGPIFSGEQLQPYLCLEALAPGPGGQPRRFAIGNGDFIERALDESCSIETRVDYLYRSSTEGGQFRPLADPGSLPPDVVTVTTTNGATVPFVLRLETGSVNRAIYQTAALVDTANPEPDPWNPPSGWNGRLVYPFGGGCEAGFFQGTSTGNVLRADLLGQGYAVASSTLNVNSQGGCNDPLSAETAMMVKERFSQTYGPPVHTIGMGGSGGAMQQLLIAGAYPGVLDGILPTLTFPDAVTNFIDATECSHLLRGFLNDAELDDETKRIVGGWATWDTCDRSLAARPNRVGPDDCPSVLPAEVQYHPVENPRGIRCSIYDGMRNVFGTRFYEDVDPAPEIPFGRSPHDNVGVQYGLEALNQGLLSKTLFLELNEEVGGWDMNGQWRPERTEADPDALRIAYETGRVTSGTGGLAITPIIDERSYTDLTGDFHTSYYSFVTRARLIRDNGHADNYVLMRRPSQLPLGRENLTLMDEWLTNIALDASGDPMEIKVARARPEALAESCWEEDGTQILEPQVFDDERLFDNTEGRCNTLFPLHTGPRMVAGGPLANDVLKCQLKPLDRGDYEVAFDEDEWARLERIFPDGVCDWSRPGVGQGPMAGTWLSFGPSPVNRY